MAYPIKLFDYNTIEGKKDTEAFIKNLDTTLTGLFGIIKPVEKIHKVAKISSDIIPKYLSELGNKAVNEIMKGVPGMENLETKDWKASIGVYGRKDGSMVKKEKDVLFRMIINIGSIEIYNLCGEEFGNEQVVLPNGYALIISSPTTEDLDVKVRNNPIRDVSKFKDIISKIRPRIYMRSMIVLDLMVPKK